MTENRIMDGNIYVVGYPKSGNTWLVRMLARIMDIKVNDKPMDDKTVDLAAHVNNKITSDSVYRVSKIHYMPNDFLRCIDSAPKYIVYIMRDIRDVIVSSFFYFRYKGREEYIYNLPTIGIKFNPRNIYKYFKARRQFDAFLFEFMDVGVSGFGTWKKHLDNWTSFLRERSDIRSSIITYENLLNNTRGEIDNVLAKLNIEPSIDNVNVVLEQESFDSLKKESKMMYKEQDAYPAEYYESFFRKGVSGGWVKFFSNRQIDFVINRAGEVMEKCGYINGNVK